MRSVVQALGSKTQCSSWACMCRCTVTLPWPKHHVMVLNHPSGTYIKYMLHHWISITGHMWSSTPSLSPSMVKSWLLMVGYGVYCVAVVVPDGPDHVLIFILYANKGFRNLALLWIWLSYRHHTHPTPRILSHFWRNMWYFIEGIWCVGQHMRS